jgi:hypothetical protein
MILPDVEIAASLTVAPPPAVCLGDAGVTPCSPSPPKGIRSLGAPYLLRIAGNVGSVAFSARRHRGGPFMLVEKSAAGT